MIEDVPAARSAPGTRRSWRSGEIKETFHFFDFFDPFDIGGAVTVDGKTLVLRVWAAMCLALFVRSSRHRGCPWRGRGFLNRIRMVLGPSFAVHPVARRALKRMSVAWRPTSNPEGLPRTRTRRYPARRRLPWLKPLCAERTACKALPNAADGGEGVGKRREAFAPALTRRIGVG